MTASFDYDLCESYGVGLDLAPEVFLIADDEQLALLKAEVGDDLAESVRGAARRCPKAAITLQE